MRLDVFSCRRLSTEPPTHSRYNTAHFIMTLGHTYNQTDKQIKRNKTERQTGQRIYRETYN